MNYNEHIGKYLFCVRTDKVFGIRQGKGYKIISVEEYRNEFYYNIMTEKSTGILSDGIAFKPTSKSFLSVEESQVKLRQLKFERILGGTEDQTYLT